MSSDDPLQATHATVDEIRHRVMAVAESLSLSFDRWDEQYVSGPSLYFIVLADVNFGAYADPLGANVWPVDVCRVATNSIESFVTAARDVAFERDGAIVITADGTIQEQMVRIRSPSAAEVERRDEIAYADWMGTKHLSAVEVSTRTGVLFAVTVSEENGRVSIFENGQFNDYQRQEIGSPWRPTS
ncbi:diadenylate cyclase [Haloquadratum walsbyi]|jgi:Uncharacterized conserved protein|uniref:DAC domain-containing protein n=1 Tax=Haloquadratum walsbyi J07HQW2 TaxID=1238425 RepID=U1NE80_9EURY|nr:diadenylate cyclase [Haloquadratum walsbyi]ERG95058.1 MAG: hypothetical protein J07HQW2_01503 [Haloquadratum walsbyi J07HQW2]